MEESSDSNVVGSSTCNEKLSKKVKAKEGAESIISKLPEQLISHILSLLPAKGAVRTSVLSKKWAYRWTSITKLDLDDSVFYSPKGKSGGKQYFMNFVYRALLLTKNPSIESFSLVMTYDYDVYIFNTWISGILNRNVKNLHICSHYGVFPFNAHTSNSLFDSEVLEELVLKRICTIPVFKTFLYFGHLKSLKLCSVVFDLQSSSSEDLTLSLPVLEVFEIKNCTWFYAVLFYELDSLPIKISASRLTKFTFCSDCYRPRHVLLLDPSSAHNASADITIRCDEDSDSVSETGSYASLLLRQFSEVKYLKFDGAEVLPLSESNVATLPVFGRLSHLELGLVTAEFLLALLLRSPVLRTLAFKGIFQFDKELFNSATVPHCLTSTLQLVNFGKLHGLEHELSLAKFVMENGVVMERMSFSLANHGLAKSKIIEELNRICLHLRKASLLLLLNFLVNRLQKQVVQVFYVLLFFAYYLNLSGNGES